MMIINNEVIYTDYELAEMAYEQEDFERLDKHSFIKGFLFAMDYLNNEAKNV